MNVVNCLNELESPYTFQSSLTIWNTTTSRYCVLAENCFIIFKEVTDVISLYRVPLNKDTKLEFTDEYFTISYFKFTISFYNKEEWFDCLNNAIKEDVKESSTDIQLEVVKVENISSGEGPLVFHREKCRIRFYESFDFLSWNVCSHEINLKYAKSIIFQGDSLYPLNHRIIINTDNEVYTLEFTTAKIAKMWAEIIQKSYDNYMGCLVQIYWNPSNQLCVDCGSPHPKWVSINLCITLCEECAISHRKLGSVISRIESANRNTKFLDGSLIGMLFIELGNDKANRFWNKMKSGRNSGSIEQRYKNKEFIDIQFSKLSLEEIKEKLIESVKTDNVKLTMCLWFSRKGYFDRVFVDDLLKTAKEFNQTLQEQFILLQENVNEQSLTSDLSLKPLHEGFVTISLNLKNKKYSKQLISIFTDRLVIQKQCHENNCTVFMNFIHMVLWNNSEKSLQISVTDKCTLYKKGSLLSSPVYVTNIIIKEPSDIDLINFKTSLLHCLCPNYLEPPTLDTSLLFITSVQVNNKEFPNCKCYLTNRDLVLAASEFAIYDVAKSIEMTVSKDSQTVSLRISNDEIHLRVGENSEIVMKYLLDASKQSLLSLDDGRTVWKLKILINFIKSNGLQTEGVFRNCGQTKKVESLFNNIKETRTIFHINSEEYTVNDATSCLKLCLQRYLGGCLVPDYVFELLVRALDEKTDQDKVSAFKMALKKMMEINLEILRDIIELFYMITQTSRINKMDSKNLAISTGQSVFSVTTNGFNDNTQILQYLIDHFVVIFEYSEREQRLMNKIIGK